MDIDEEKVIEDINKLRKAVLLHSALYYGLDDSILTDTQFDNMCKCLVNAHKKYANLLDKCKYGEGFEDWTGSSGYQLPWMPLLGLAHIVIRYHISIGRPYLVDENIIGYKFLGEK